MALKTREDYLEALRKLRPNIYKFGELIEDVTTHPATKRTIESHSLAYDASHDPELAELYTTSSIFTGEKIHRWNSMMQESDDLISNMNMKRQNYRRSGTCTGAVCVGWNAQNTLWAVTEEIDEEFGTDYKERLKKWILYAQVKEVREDGIIIRGAKLMICGTAASQEIFLLPGGVYKEEDSKYALACVVPRDVEGLTIIEATRPSDRRDLEDTAEGEVPNTGITQGLLFFEDVFVPNERVFMCGEAKYTTKFIQFFTTNYRACIGACVAGQGDVMVGASVLMARANGLSTKVFSNKLVEMSINNQVTYGLGVGACAMGIKHPSGSFFADPLTAHTNKVMVATLPYETKRLTQEIGGGIVETGCMPSYKDFTNPEYGELLQKYYKAGNASAEARYRAARLSEWLTIGGGVPGCMHGGGSPDGARLIVRFMTPFEEYADYAREIIGIEEKIPEPDRKR
jgi:4-hydroxybutyryl-CoA dehydratase/vinylacetyl-CoA-Delta-isomerase